MTAVSHSRSYFYSIDSDKTSHWLPPTGKQKPEAKILTLLAYHQLIAGPISQDTDPVLSKCCHYSAMTLHGVSSVYIVKLNQRCL